jgi:fumarate reductase flavoprotein subunit
MMNILAQKARELGVQILLKTPATKLLKENGRIVGTIAQDASGEEIRVKAKAVISSCGGVGSGSQSVFKDGDGVRMAKEAGAAVRIPAESGPVMGPPPGFGGGDSSDKSAAPRTAGPGMHSHVNVCFQQGSLMVNLLGERFMNEEITVNTPFGASAIGRQKDGVAITIFDEDAKNHYKEYLDHVPGIVAESQSLTEASNFDVEIEQIIERGVPSIFVANSIEELAVKVGVDPDALKATVDEYNIACDTGRDNLFNKPAKWLRPVRTPRFYANKSGAMGGNSEYGGIKINYKTEVLTDDFTVIPGLYAVGMDAAYNIYYDIYPNILPATAMGFPVISGRMAAKNALEYIETIR